MGVAYYSKPKLLDISCSKLQKFQKRNRSYILQTWNFFSISNDHSCSEPSLAHCNLWSLQKSFSLYFSKYVKSINIYISSSFKCYQNWNRYFLDTRYQILQWNSVSSVLFTLCTAFFISANVWSNFTNIFDNKCETSSIMCDFFFKILSPTIWLLQVF